MKYLTEFRDPGLTRKLVQKIENMADKEITIMEVCGTHTMAIFKSGLRQLLPHQIRLISGPGCPVCVTPQSYIDTAIQLTERQDVIITAFGDMLRVPGTEGSLMAQKSKGRDVRMVYSPLDVVQLAAENPQKEVIFLAVGFETTAPTIALSVEQAKKANINNYSILQSIKTMPNTMEELVREEDIQIDGFLCPGHVSAVIGVKPYRFLSEKYSLPAVIAGFEPTDIIMGIYHILDMLDKKESQVRNEYTRLVTEDGNLKALEMIERVFEETASVWRGLGSIEGTGLRLRQDYESYDTVKKLGIQAAPEQPAKGCICGEILKGKVSPLDCRLFSTKCTPETPVGACMVSEEGTCAAYYRYKPNHF
ncbi:hydrogenase formation protein HypD [Geosporobacter ferrireducens]|uniref:Hydrogenase formation protein HypD n=1 Tax=Geosporobacter ferrireducens TaxID=1424294 RepID=A0A1D8GL58_9FIRM|nr:hydrogenase formation protein HypD [Geosporobacter ferrireducens]AOT71640.1 hydrogenase formation protein HypD [Geosporobacter ferrireducens]